MGGRGAYSAISKKSIQHGTIGTVSRSAALNALKSGFSVKAKGGKIVRFTSAMNKKYMQGKGRKDGKSPERLYHLGKAVTAVKYANSGIYHLKKDNPPQTVYLHRTGENSGMVVFTDTKTRHVRGFIPVGNLSYWKKNLMNRQ